MLGTQLFKTVSDQSADNLSTPFDQTIRSRQLHSSGKQAQALRCEPDLNLDGYCPIVKAEWCYISLNAASHAWVFHQDAWMPLLQNQAFVPGCLWHMPSIVSQVDKRGEGGGAKFNFIIFERMVKYTEYV